MSKRLRCILLAASLLTLTVASGCGRRSPAEKRHPLSSNIAEVDAVRHIGWDSSASGQMALLADRLRSAHAVMEIAPDESTAAKLIGGVAGLWGLADGSLVHLDDRYNVVRIYDAEGIVIDETGSDGRGPGEFVLPVDLAATDSAVYVLDKIGRLVSMRRTPVGLSAGSTTVLPLEPSRLCVANGRMFLTGIAADARSALALLQVHEIDPVTEELLSSFSPGYSDGNATIRMALSEAISGCSAEAQTIATVPLSYPLVRGYDFDGHLKWATWVDTITPNYWLETVDEGRPAARPLKGAYMDTVEDIVAVPGGYLLLQAFRSVPRGSAQRSDIGFHSYLIDADSGEGVYLGRRLPRINFVSDEYFLATHYDAGTTIARYTY